MAVLTKITTGLVAFASAAMAVQQISTKGSNFVNSDGSRFDIIGVDYQPGGSAGFNPGSGVDPLGNSTQCLRDAAILQNLGVNAIRVYNLDPAISHDDCAGIFNSVGIYMIIDVNSPLTGQSLSAAAPWTTYDKDYLQRVFQVIEAFKGYDNLIGFFSGNEVINDENSGSIDPPYIRAVTRDMKNYIAKQSPNRAIPVGYSAADVRDILEDTYNYLACAENGDSSDMSRIDFFGLNSYSWCGQSSIQQAGYDVLVQDFANSSVPVFFSEYGCNAVTPREFTEVQAIYGDQMRATFSGGLVYEYTQEDNNFGLVKVAADSSAQLLADFDNFQAQINKLSLTQLAVADSTAESRAPLTCDPGMISSSSFSKNFTLPAVPDGVQDMIDNGVQGAAGGSQLTQPTATAVPMPVLDSSNNPIQNLAISILPNNQVNTPTGKNQTGASGPASGAAAAATPTASGSPAQFNQASSTATQASAVNTTVPKSGAGKAELMGAGGIVALAMGAIMFML